jgi:hypothetical protein
MVITQAQPSYERCKLQRSLPIEFNRETALRAYRAIEARLTIAPDDQALYGKV